LPLIDRAEAVDAMNDFFQMGGYAAFVWPALGLTAAVLITMAVASLLRLRASEAALGRAEASGGRRRRARSDAKP